MTKNKLEKPVGRPVLPEKKRRNKIVQFRCTEQEYKIIESAARKKGVKVSDWIRDSVLKTAS